MSGSEAPSPKHLVVADSLASGHSLLSAHSLLSPLPSNYYYWMVNVDMFSLQCVFRLRRSVQAPPWPTHPQLLHHLASALDKSSDLSLHLPRG